MLIKYALAVVFTLGLVSAAVAAGTWTNPGWLGAPASYDANIATPSGATVTEHSYAIQWAVTNVGSSTCLRDVEVKVSWTEPNRSAPKELDFATRRYNYGDPSC